MSVEQIQTKAELSVRNIGGIDETEVVFEPGVTILAGRNATNRTSLLQAIMAVLGSDDVSMKADADEAHVELSIGDDIYTRTLEERGGTIRTDGDPYLEDSTLADLFTFLLKSNEARRAVETDASLRDIIMRPVDTDEIEAEIDRLVERRRQLKAELGELDELKSQLPALEEKRTQLREEIEKTEEDLAAIEEQIEATDADIEESREEQAEIEEKLENLRKKRSTLEDVRYDIDTEKDSLESLRNEKAEVETEYDEISEMPSGDIEELEARIDRLRSQKQQFESELNDIQSVVQFNENMLDESAGDILERLDGGDESGSDAVTDKLLGDDTVTCWTCGSEVDAEQIESTIETLREYSQETIGKVNDIDDELDELKERRQDLQKQQHRRERLEHCQQNLEDDIENTEARIDDLSDRRDELRKDIEEIEAEIEALENETYEKILAQHKEANQLEYDLGSLESDLENVEENIATIEERLDEKRELETRCEEINDELKELRTKIERIERQAVEEFNEHMNAVLELLEFQNLDRIWLERVEREVREGRHKVTKSIFELHIVRQTRNGTTYEDTIDNLSESEREVTGLIFALAGYLAHEVYETIPFMLLDSLEAIDADRIAMLVDYLKDYSDYQIVALLPEDATALNNEYDRIFNI